MIFRFELLLANLFGHQIAQVIDKMPLLVLTVIFIIYVPIAYAIVKSAFKSEENSE